MLSDSQIGIAGEDAAAEYLQSKGYTIISRNYELPMGELDIIARKGEWLCFVEVKTSIGSSSSWFKPSDRVDRRKRQTLQRLCETYCLRERIDLGSKWQVDVISVTLDKEGKNPHIEHIENAIWDYRGV